MTSTFFITVDGYEFEITAYYEASVLINSESPLTDKAFLKALGKVQNLLRYFTALHLFNCMGGQAGVDTVYLTIEAYEKKLIPVPEKSYQKAIEVRSHIEKPRPVAAVKTPKPPIAGYVYLIKSPSGHFKIGRAIDPNDRLRTFGVQLPFEVEHIALIKTDDYKGLEKSLHLQYADKHVNGEWFNLSDEDVEYIKSLAVGVNDAIN